MVRVLHTALCLVGEIGKRIATVKGAMVSNHLEIGSNPSLSTKRLVDTQNSTTEVIYDILKLEI